MKAFGAGDGFWSLSNKGFDQSSGIRVLDASGRQIDGSVTISGTTYLVELSLTREQVGAPDIDSILAKIADKADNTMGIMLSMSGYSTVALEGASGRRTPLLLMDHRHVYFALSGAMPFGELIERIRRHASKRERHSCPRISLVAEAPATVR